MLAILYDMTMRWANHRNAPVFLAMLSFAESSFLPVPPDVMLAPMSMAKPKSAWRYALIATLFSVFGGVFGYFLGVIFEPAMLQFIEKAGYTNAYSNVKQLFDSWGFWAVLLAGATPIPYKVFTIGAGVLQFNLFGFIVASVLGRGLRFFLVSSLMKFNGNRIDQFCRYFFAKHGKSLFITVVLLVLIYIIFYKL